jgi:sigma-B regulation protein RsbU (phosphoserine phosphatase)
MASEADLDREIQIAHEIQMSTLPSFMPVVPGYDFAGRFWPTDRTGGDTFDIVAIDPEHVFLLLGDATGHGIGPALSALQVQSMFRVALRLGADLDDAFKHVNDQMVEDLPDGRFVTAVFGLLNTTSHVFRFHSAGQGPILHFQHADSHCAWFEPSHFPMGFLELDELQESQHLSLAPGDILALITDGIFEYENEKKEHFGMQRVADIVRELQDRPMAELMETLKTEAQNFGGSAPQLDDITIVLIRRATDSA